MHISMVLLYLDFHILTLPVADSYTLKSRKIKNKMIVCQLFCAKKVENIIIFNYILILKLFLSKIINNKKKQVMNCIHLHSFLVF